MYPDKFLKVFFMICIPMGYPGPRKEPAFTPFRKGLCALEATRSLLHKIRALGFQVSHFSETQHDYPMGVPNQEQTFPIIVRTQVHFFGNQIIL